MAQETTYAKSDFVPGDEIIFDDNFEGERLGEFPLSWDLLDGYAEMAQQQGRNVIAFTDNGLGQVMPLMKQKWDWLPALPSSPLSRLKPTSPSAVPSPLTRSSSLSVSKANP